VAFHFKGVAAHAANSPHLGRSALDAVELMNIGVNYLREHVIQDARIHYAVTDTGGFSPNVIQSEATALYLIRAPQINEVDAIYERICHIAEGASLMTETEVAIEFNKACSNYIPNRQLEKVLYKNVQHVGADIPTAAEINDAKQIWHTLTKEEQDFYVELMEGFGYFGDGSEFEGKYVSDCISDYNVVDKLFYGSTDVADVSWVVPTAQMSAATSALGTPLHTWQMTAQGISSFAHKGMLRAAKAMALTGVELMIATEKLIDVQKEHAIFKAKNQYVNPIPKHVKPTSLSGKKINQMG